MDAITVTDHNVGLCSDDETTDAADSSDGKVAIEIESMGGKAPRHVFGNGPVARGDMFVLEGFVGANAFTVVRL